MWGSRLLVCLAVALLGLILTAPTASAQCRQISALKKVGQSFYGATCYSLTYMTTNGKTIKSTSCTCHATVCTFCWAPKICNTSVGNAYCVPLTLVKSP